jgi:hypothetical protein
MEPIASRDQSEDSHSQEDTVCFIKDPEVIRMHLDILYKTIPLLSKERILAILEPYKKEKERKRKEAKERI